MNRKTMLEIVNEVKKRPCLWDTDDEYYHNRGRVSVAWEEITAALNLPGRLDHALCLNIIGAVRPRDGGTSTILQQTERKTY